MLGENDELTRGGGGYPSHLARLAIPTAPIIPFLFYPFSWGELIYLLLSVGQRPSRVERQNKSSTFTCLSPTNPSSSLNTQYLSYQHFSVQTT